MTRPSVPFHDAPTAGASKYADVIAKAKAGQVAERPGDLVNTPSFDETQRSWESRKPQKTQLSAKTTSGLSALAERNAQLERPRLMRLGTTKTTPLHLLPRLRPSLQRPLRWMIQRSSESR